MKKTVIILFLSLLAYAAPAQTFELENKDSLEDKLYSILGSKWLLANPIPKYIMAGDTLIETNRLRIYDLITYEHIDMTSTLPRYGIYGFCEACVIPSYTYIFLKYDNTYRILDMKQYMGINELKRQLLQIYDFFDKHKELDSFLEIDYIRAACHECRDNIIYDE